MQIFSWKQKYHQKTKCFNSNLNKKAEQQTIDFSEYKSGVRVYHKKFGEGTINWTT